MGGRVEIFGLITMPAFKQNLRLAAAVYVVVFSCCCYEVRGLVTRKPSSTETLHGVSYDIFKKYTCINTKNIASYRRTSREACAIKCNARKHCKAFFWTTRKKCYLKASTCTTKIYSPGFFSTNYWCEKGATATPTATPTTAPTKEGTISTISALPRDYRRLTIDGTDYYPFIFAKTLRHSSEHLMPTAADVDAVLSAVDSTEDGAWEPLLRAIKQHPETGRMLEGIQSGYGLTGITRAETSMLLAEELPPVDSVEHLCQMVEVYWQSLLRDVPFAEYPSDEGVKAAVIEMNKCATMNAWSGPTVKNKVTWDSLFRGIGQGELFGPYVSQFLLNDFNYGGLLVKQKYSVENDVPSSVTTAGWLDMQHGVPIDSQPPSNRWHNVNGRVIGSEVHMDAVFQFYYNAAMQVAQFEELDLDDPWHFLKAKDVKSSAWADGGLPDVFVSLAKVSIGALRHAWWNKWQGAMQIRPEVYAARLDQMKSNDLAGGKIREISNVKFLETLDSSFTPTFEAVADANKKLFGSEQQDMKRKYLLNMLYAEGSPTHPSYPAGHAVIAGACVTVLKAFCKTHTFLKKTGQYSRVAWKKDVVEAKSPSSDGLHTLGKVRGMTVNGELNKLGSNVALARDFAGVHYRSDSDLGIKLGEAYALEFLRSQLLEYASPHMKERSFTVELYNGTLTEITRLGIRKLSAQVN